MNFHGRQIPLHRRDTILLAAGMLFFAAFYNLPYPTPEATRLLIPKVSAAAFRGEYPYSDIAADIIGFRRLYLGGDPYPILGPALAELGIDWDVAHTHTHPPTAFLFAAPIAFLPWKTASSLWAFASLAGIAASFLLLGWPWRRALGLALLIPLWPPAALSMGQLTVIWLLGFALAYRLTSPNNPAGGFASGAVIGIASLTKFFPALLLAPHIVARRYRALVGFGLVWLAALAAVWLMHPGALARYLEINVGNSMTQIERLDNASVVALAFRSFGLGGVALVIGCACAILLAVLWGMRRRGGLDHAKLWMLSLYFSVALLPIMWMYSLLPLIPVIWYFLNRNNKAADYAALYAIGVPAVAPMLGPIMAPALGSVIVVLGAAFIADSVRLPALERRRPVSAA